MNFKSRILERVINAALITALFLITGIYSCVAQTTSLAPTKFMGFEAAFGARSFLIRSSIPQINQMDARLQGGSVGVVYGNDYWRASIKPFGYYLSNNSTKHTVELLQKSASINFYPLQYLRNNNKQAADLYVTGGISMDKIKFSGYYLNDDKTINYSTGDEPYLGKLSQLNMFSGVGVEFHLPYRHDFVHLFVEAHYSKLIHSETDKVEFTQTSTKDFITVNIGVRFGDIR